jgi:hypothetical protein
MLFYDCLFQREPSLYLSFTLSSLVLSFLLFQPYFRAQRGLGFGGGPP